jgi:GNAT superfamily N-acetyltransferase
MIVIVRDIINDTEQAFSGSEEQVEDQLRHTFPGVALTVEIGDLDHLIWRIGGCYGKQIEVPEGHVAKPELHLPIRFDPTPHTCESMCPQIRKTEENFSEELDNWLLEKAISDIAPGEETGEKAAFHRDGIKSQVYDYSHVIPEHLKHQYRIQVHERPKGTNMLKGGTLCEAFLVKHPFDFVKDDIGKVSAMVHPKYKNGDKDMRIVLSQIEPEHRGKKLGMALYEAVMAHAKHYHGATHAVGGVHSTMAHRTHEALARRHGLEYTANFEDSDDHKDFGPGEFDDAYGPYLYAIKSENEVELIKADRTTFKEAGFRNKNTNEIAGTGIFHNIYELPEHWKVDEDHLEHIEAGFIDHGGQFYNRAEAAAKVNAPKPLQSEDVQGMGRKAGEEQLGGGAGLVKMAIADIPPGVEKRGQKKYGLTRYSKFFDYSHVLSPLQKRHYFLTAVNANGGGGPQEREKYRIYCYSRRLRDYRGWPMQVGDATVRIHDFVGAGEGESYPEEAPRAVSIDDVRVHHRYRNKGLGTAIYEAAFAHAKHHHKATHVTGGTHSSMAAAVHRKLAAKHGLDYHPVHNAADYGEVGTPDYQKPSGIDYDAAHGPYQYTLKSEADSLMALASNLNNTVNDDSELVEDMSGFAPRVHSAFEAARFLVNGREALSLDQIRRALWLEDGDFERAALRAYNIEPDEIHLASLRAVMKLGFLHKSENPQPMRVDCPISFSANACSEVQRGISIGLVQHVNLNGKYSKGSMVVRDPKSDHVYLLKPDSEGISPAAGVGEEPDVSQPKREAAFWQCANILGLGGVIPRADLVKIDNDEWAAIRLLPYNFKNLEKRWKVARGEVMAVLERYRAQGMLHKWGALDYILGNPDRHGQNLMIGHAEKQAPVERDIALIDHGSAFAGHAFAPSADANSFIPFYLRAWAAPAGFNKLPPNDKLRQMPTVGREVNEMLKRWIQEINPTRIEKILKQYGIDPAPVLMRISKLKMLPDSSDIAICKLWAGAA